MTRSGLPQPRRNCCCNWTSSRAGEAGFHNVRQLMIATLVGPLKRETLEQLSAGLYEVRLVLSFGRAVRVQTHVEDVQRHVNAVWVAGDKQEQIPKNSTGHVIRSSPEREVSVHPDGHLPQAECTLQALDAAGIELHRRL